MKNDLYHKGILTHEGKICKDKINLVSGAITKPLVEMIWVSTGGDMDTVNRITDILVTMNNRNDRPKLFKIIQMLYGVMGIQFSDEAALMAFDENALEYFIFSFSIDFGEIVQEYLAEQNSK